MKKDRPDWIYDNIRSLNNILKPVSFLIPLIDGILCSIGITKQFTALYYKGRFWQVAKDYSRLMGCRLGWLTHLWFSKTNENSYLRTRGVCHRIPGRNLHILRNTRICPPLYSGYVWSSTNARAKIKVNKL